MAGPHPIMPDDLDRELADALRAEPSAEFRARIRARVDGEYMSTGWRVPAAAYAGFAGVIVASAIWFMPYGAPPVRQVIDAAPSARPPEPVTEASSTNVAPPLGTPPRERGRTSRRVTQSPAMAQATGSVNVPASAPVSVPEVLLSDSERAGVRLLLESAASGRLRLPEEMLRDLSLPIVEARTTFPDPDSPWVTVEGAVQ